MRDKNSNREGGSTLYRAPANANHVCSLETPYWVKNCALRNPIPTVLIKGCANLKNVRNPPENLSRAPLYHSSVGKLTKIANNLGARRALGSGRDDILAIGDGWRGGPASDVEHYLVNRTVDDEYRDADRTEVCDAFKTSTKTDFDREKIGKNDREIKKSESH